MNVIWYVRAGDYIAAHHALLFEKWLGRLRDICRWGEVESDRGRPTAH